MEQRQSDVTPHTPSHVHIKHVGWMYIVLVVISFTAVIGTGFGVYYLQQGQIDTLSKALSDEHNKKTAPIKDVAALTTPFARAPVPFTFTYPSEWTMTTDRQLDGATNVNNYPSYTITLYVPGAADEASAVGPKNIVKGAKVEVYASKTNYKSAPELVKSPGFDDMAKDLKDITIAGLPGLRYYLTGQGADLLTSTVIKDGWQYAIRMDAEGKNEGEELKHAAFKDYEAIVKSFSFK